MTYYKGFDQDLKCRGFQFEEGKTYSIAEDPSLCQKGFHYSANIFDCISFYVNNRKNKFAIVEPLGSISDKQTECNFDSSSNLITTIPPLKNAHEALEISDKYATNKIKIVRVLSQEEVDKLYFESSPHFKLIQYLTEKYNVIIGGSFGLLLQGINLNRNLNFSDIDLDIIIPYYQPIETDLDNKVKVEATQVRTSGNDFSSKLALSIDNRHIGVDIRIDPYAQYANVSYNGKVYKAGSMLETLAAKIRYAKQGDPKHTEDIKNIINQVNYFNITKEESTSIRPF